VRAATTVGLIVGGLCLGSAAFGHFAVDSGVRGRVTVGPSCGAISKPPYPGCGDAPYATTIRVRRARSKKVVKRVATDRKGHFKIRLRPGQYLLAPRSGDPYPQCVTTEVKVSAHRFARRHLGCESGIR